MNVGQGNCARCGEADAYRNVVCTGCGSRLPWADALDEARREAVKAHAGDLASAKERAETAEAARKKAEDKRSLGIYQTTNGDRPSFITALLGFICPPGGALIWLMQNEQYPERASSAGKGALIGLFVGIVLSASFWLGLFSHLSNFR
jgi:hypothetical protein